MAEYYAHSLPDQPPPKWHKLEDHLKSTAEKARQFAEPFGAGDWAYLAGLWHDLGKYSDEFQAYLLRENGFEAHIENIPGRIDHSTAGAKYAAGKFEILGHLLAYQIAGHHSGLLNGRSDGACMDNRLRKEIAVSPNTPSTLLDKPIPDLPDFIKNAFTKRDGFSIAFFTRILFSCLVDADFLNTEEILSPQISAERPTNLADIFIRMEKALEDYVSKFTITDAPVNQDRTNVRNMCLKKAALPKGFFSLTVPTGGGKTLSSLAFALRHANICNEQKNKEKSHTSPGVRRIVYVIPFTSIIEQNAEEFRKAIASIEGGAANQLVIEHHSNFDPDKETPYSRLACENWDAPLIVTTSVQFYESLFANRTSNCRKLHNLSNAIIIIDEAQTIPVDYLEPCLRALKELVLNYGATVVLCTATQPAVHLRPDFRIGIDHVREIIDDPPALYRRLKRVEVNHLGTVSDTELVKMLRAHEQALFIVNTVRHAQTLSRLLGEDPSHFHLTAAKCPAHRSVELKAIRERLDQGKPCRVISTQLVEAGVDVDFPVVYRSMAGIDSIAQAAGRCNRHGRMSSLGKVYVFQSEHGSSERFFADTTKCAGEIFAVYDNDPMSLEAINHYFKLYYWDQDSRWDTKHICDSFKLDDRDLPFLFDFSRVAGDFKLIQQMGRRPVVVPWGEEGRLLCEKLKVIPSLNREVCRYLQRYTVQAQKRIWLGHLDRGIKSLFGGSLGVLTCPEIYYSQNYGLSFEEPSGEGFIVERRK